MKRGELSDERERKTLWPKAAWAEPGMDVDDHWLQNSLMECRICVMGKSSRSWQWLQGLLFLFSLFVFICFCYIIWEVISCDSYLRKNVLDAVWLRAQGSQRETNWGEDSMSSWSCFLWVTSQIVSSTMEVWFCSPTALPGPDCVWNGRTHLINTHCCYSMGHQPFEYHSSSVVFTTWDND